MRRDRHTLSPRHPVLEDLEPRILFSADHPAGLIATALTNPGDPTSAQVAIAAPATLQPGGSEIVFIDASVRERATLVADIQAQAAAGRAIEVVELDDTRDGIQQINDALAGRSDVSAIHVIAHGSEAHLSIGDTTLDHDTLLARADEIAAWGNHLTPDADLLLYGCDLAAGADGRALVDGLAQLTGADVAASTDITGATALGGNWTLEVATGAVAASSAIDPAGQAQWQDVLAANSAPTIGTAGTGSVTTNVNATDAGNAAVLQPDGKAVVVGSANGQFAVVRYNQNGSLDTTFNSTGKVTTTIGSASSANSVVIQSDGKIVVAGYTQGLNKDFAIVRYNANGSLDTSFGTNGIKTVNLVGADDIATSVALQSDGKIVVSGTAVVVSVVRYATIRLNSDGSTDSSFGSSGQALQAGQTSGNQVYGVTMQTDGKILVVATGTSGSNVLSSVIRYNTDGTLDTSFGTNGVAAVLSSVQKIVLHDALVQSDGKIVLTGSMQDTGWGDADLLIVRLNTNGTLDTSFGTTSGYTTFRFPSNAMDMGMTIAERPDGSLIAGGTATTTRGSYEFATVSANGIGVATFGGSSYTTVTVGSSSDTMGATLVTATGKILAFGTSTSAGADIGSVRYTAAGVLDTTWGGSGQLGDAVPYAVLGSPVVLDNDVTFSDTNLNASNFAGATLTLARTGGANAQDQFSATGLLGTLTQGGNLVYNGTTIGTVTTNSGGTLLLTFNASATQTLVNNAARCIAYANSSASPAGQVQIDWTINDGNTGAQGTGGALSATGSTTLVISVPASITSNGGGATASVSVAENTTAVTTVTSAGTGTQVYSIVGGADAAKFTINSSTGALAFVTAPDYEAPTDSGANNVYDVTVQVSDGTVTDTQAIAVTVTDVSSALAVTTTADTNDSGIVAGNSAYNNEWLNANKGADGAISLREAIIAANNTSGADAISFNIAGAGLHTISLASALPTITGQLTIDGYTQSGASVNTASVGSNAALMIEVDGASAGSVNGLFNYGAGANGSIIKGLVINDAIGSGLNGAAIYTSGGASNVTVVGNFIGVNASGTAAKADNIGISVNTATGWTIGSSALADRNLIAAGAYANINLNGTTTGAVIQGNVIGTRADGTTPLGSTSFGVISQNGGAGLLGGTGAAQGNVIVGATKNVVVNTPTSTLTVLGNLISQASSFEIDLSNDGVTANDAGDADTGANNLQNFPVLSAVTTNGSTLHLNVALNSTANSYYRVELFASSAADGTGYGPGQRYLGSLNITTDASGNGNLSISLTGAAVVAGQVVTATATQSNSSFTSTTATSEFSQAVTAAATTQAVITSNGGGATAAVSVPETTTAVTTVAASGGGITYAISGGADAAKFTINSSTGALAFASAPDYENPTDAGANNVYDVIVKADDGTYNSTQAIAVTVTDVASTLVVTTAADNNDSGITTGATYTNEWLNAHEGADGAISLREAIIAANNTAGADTISFAIPGGGVQTINVASALPTITGQVTIDGTTQSGASANTASQGSTNAVMTVVLNGASAGAGVSGLVLGAGSGGSTIRGLVIDSFTKYGISVTSGANSVIAGNFIGVNAAGTAAAGNGWGIVVTGGSNLQIGSTPAADRNLIAGNNTGVDIEAVSNVLVRGNQLGLNASGSATIGTTTTHFYIDGGASSVQIGGPGAGEGNVIAGGTLGVDVAGSYGGTTRAAILGNSIYANTGLGIDLKDDGIVTANDVGDADTGPNNLQNFPVLASARTNGSSVSIAGTLNSTANGYFHIEFFASSSASPSGHGGGQRYLGYVNVATDGSGNASVSTTLASAVAAGELVSATATLSNAGYTTYTATSEFATNVTATSSATITSNGGGTSASVNVAENTTAVTTVAASGSGLTYSISGGADAAKFAINAATGALSFAAAPNYEAPTDAGANNVYDVIVQASDGTLSSTQAIAVTVTNANEAPVFGTGPGYVIDPQSASLDDAAFAVVVQPDGKIVSVGTGSNYTLFTVERHNADGTLDTTFGSGGIASINFGGSDDAAEAVALQADGKIVITGRTGNNSNSDIGVARLNSNGSLDTSFGSGGKVTTSIGANGEETGYGVALQSDGKIVVTGRASVGGGNAAVAVLRYTSSGALDASFGTAGVVTTTLGATDNYGYAVKLQSDGKIVVAGYTFQAGNWDTALLRYTTSGALDTTFNGTGQVITAVVPGSDGAYALLVQSDGKIVLAGTAQNATWDVAIERYTGAGALDTTFGGTGKVSFNLGSGDDTAYAIAQQSDGKYVLAGSSWNGTNNDIVTIRVTTAGALDTSFNGTGIATLDAGDAYGYGVAVQSDGRIVVVGQSNAASGNYDFITARYNSDGSIDAGFGGSGLDANVAYTENGAPLVLDGNVQVVDPELAVAGNAAGATLTLARSGGASAQDVFSASGSLSALTQGGSLVYAGVTIGTVTTNSNGTLLLTFNANATQARVNGALSSVAYANSSDAPPASVSLTWTFNDGNTGAQGSGGALATSGTSTVTITAVNDAPVLTPIAPTLTTITEDQLNNAGQTVASFAGAPIADPDGSGLAYGIAINAKASGTGTWQYSTNGGSSWTAIGNVSDPSSLLLRSTDLVRFVPNGSNGTAGWISYRAWDQTSGTAGTKVDTGTNGGTSAYSGATDAATITVTSVNDAPVLTPIAPTLATITEDQTSNAGQSVASFVGASIGDVDTGALQGIAITSSTNGTGSWQYSIDGGTSWVGVGAVGTGSALLLRSTDLLRFVPDAANGTSGSLTYRAYDGTTGSAGTKADTSTNGGTSAFSSATDTATLTVTSVNDAPVLTPIAPALSSITEDQTNPAGQTVASFVGASIGDVDSGALQGIAVTSTANGNGTWQYSTNGGSSWTNVGAVSGNTALLLRASDLVRFVPDGSNATTASIGYRAWDQTSGSVGTKVDASTNGGTSAFSSASDSASISVTAVNDAPVLAPIAPTLTTITEDQTNNAGQTVASFVGASIGDVDSGAPQGIAINAKGSGAGTWQYSIDGGASWNAVGSVGDTTALLLRATDLVRYVPDGITGGSPWIGYRAWDQSSGSAGTKVNASTNGGTTAFSAAADSATLTVTSVNDAPALTPIAPSLATITEDQTNNAGQTVASFIGVSITDVDPSAVQGIAIDAKASGTGTWQYSIDGGTSWNAVGGVGDTTALLLRATDLVRFVPDGISGSNPWLGYRAWDQSSGSAGAKVDASTTGGTSAFSSASDTATLTVTSVNDAPLLTPIAPSLTTITEDQTSNTGQTVASFVGASIGDVDSGALQGIAITATANGNGAWQFSTNGGTSWSALGAVNGTAALLLRSIDVIRYVPNGANATSATITYRAWDRSDGNGAGTTASALVNGGTSAFSSASDTATITVSAVNDAPVLTPIAPSLATITEDQTNNAGQTVASFVGASIGDVDSGAPQGIAINAKGSGAGTWQYSIDGGTSWNAVGSVGDTTVLLLRATDLVRFVPDGISGDTPWLGYRAWDQSSGSAGDKVDASANGGTSAFSGASDTATLAVSSVNDAPVLTPIAPALATITEDQTNNAGQTVASFIGASIGDVDPGAPQGIAITASTNGNGSWQVSTDGGGTWSALGSVNATQAMLLRATDRVRFVPDGLNATTATLSFRAWDQTSGSAGSKVDTSVNGGTTAYSIASDTATLTVSAVNDAPVIVSNGGGASAAISIAETTTAVTTVAATDVDLPAPTLTYSISGGADAARFTIDANTGTLAFIAAPDYENPTDANTDNVYDVIVSASDGSASTAQTLAVTVTDVSSALVVTTATDNNDAGIVSGAAYTAEWLNAHRGADGQVSLREAIIAANNTAGTDTISFAIAGGAVGPYGESTITLASALPLVTDSVVLDASTQPGTGTVAHPLIVIDGGASVADGIVLAAGSGGSTLRGFVIRGVTNDAVRIESGSAGDFIYGNYLGAFNADGSSAGAATVNGASGIAVYAANATIGDSSDADRNLISGNLAQGVHLGTGATGAIVSGNYIGTDASGNAALAQRNGTGVLIDGGATGASLTFNIIAGNASHGIDVESAGQTIRTNLIGVGLDHATEIGNGGDGIRVAASNVTIGGTSSFQRNLILGNGAAGIAIVGNVDNVLSLGNAIADNGTLAIDLGADGATPNDAGDADTGPNHLNNTPVLSAAGSDGTTTSVTGQIDVDPAITTALRIEFYASAAPDANGHGQGRRYLGFALVTPSGGSASFNVTGLAPVADGESVSATLTDMTSSTRGTSEFSSAVQASSTNTAPQITSNGGGATASIHLAENATAVTTVVGADSDLPAQTLTYSITGGADAARFAIDASTGALRFLAAPDFEAPTDSGLNNVYDVIVQVSDGALSDAQAISVVVDPVNDNPPVITSNGGGATAAVNVAENATAVTTVTATDADLPAPTLGYAIIGGIDAARFAIDASTGALRFVTAPDVEAPADADANNVYDVIVQASDGLYTDSQAIAVTVTPVNDNAPVITSNGGGATASVDVAENSTAVTTVTATDADLPAVTLTYTISGGADAARFTIDVNTGALAFIAAPDYENPLDANADNIYDVVVRASDGTLVDTQAIAVRVTPVNDNTPVITSNGGGASAAINVAENATAVTTVAASDADLPAPTLSYTIIGGADAARFTIDATTGVLRFASAPDFEQPGDVGADNTYDVIVQASDGTTTDTQALAVTVTPVDDNAPVITSNGGGASATVNVAENSRAVTTVTATDADLPTLSYAIVGGADAARFTIDAASGALRFASAPNFEAPVDANGDNVYDVVVSASGGTLATTQTLHVTVTNVNDAPLVGPAGPGFVTTDLFGANDAVQDVVVQPDGDILVGGQATDTNGEIHFALARYHADGALDVDFGSGGRVTTAFGNGPDGIFSIVVQPDGKILAAGYAQGPSNAQFAIARYNADGTLDATFGISGLVREDFFGGDERIGTLLLQGDGKIIATGCALNAGNNDFAMMRFNADGSLDTSFGNAGKVDTPIGAGTDSASGAVLQPDGKIILSGYTFNGSNLDVAVVRYNADGSLDASFGNAGVVTRAIGPGDDVAIGIALQADGRVLVSGVSFDGSRNVFALVRLNADGSLDAGFGSGGIVTTAFSGAAAGQHVIVQDDGRIAVSGSTVGAHGDDDFALVRYLSDGTLDTSFGDNGRVTTDFGHGADRARHLVQTANGALVVVGLADNGTNSDFAIARYTRAGVLDPTFGSAASSLDGTIAYTEDGAPVVLAPAVSLDDEDLDRLGTYSGASVTIARDGGADASDRYSATGALAPLTEGGALTVGGVDIGSVAVNSGGTLQLVFNAGATRTLVDDALRAIGYANDDHSPPAVVLLDWAISDGNAGAQGSGGALGVGGVTRVVITAIDDAPEITSDGGGATAARSVAENTTAVTTVAASDADTPQSQLVYSIVGGADASKFAIDASTGALRFVTAPDADIAGDANGDNVYDVIVQVSDGTLADTQAIAVTVTPVNDNTPVLTSLGAGATAAVNVAENVGTVATVTAVDADLPAQTLTYSIVGGADAARFTLDATTGALAFIIPPDAEIPTDASLDNVYDVIVQVSDGTTSDTQAIAVTVTPVNDNAPVITSDGGGASAAVSVAENTTAVTTVIAHDADLPSPTLAYAIVGGADGARFAIDANTGALRFVTAPDAELPLDANGDNVYDVIVRASDGTLTDTQTLAVTVTPVNDNAPTITSDGGGVSAAIDVAENVGAVTTIIATDADLPAQALTYSISGGADAARFTIDANTGALAFIVAPDHENPTDANADNVYDVIVQASDGASSDTQAIAVTVTAVDEFAPVITSDGGGPTAALAVAENSTAVTTVTATDADAPAATLTYSIAGGADAARFAIDASTGALRFVTAPDADVPGDANGDNIYDVIVQVDDGMLTDTQALAVSVTPVNDNVPVITSNGGGAASAAINVAENTTAVTTVTATDADLPAQTLTYTIVGGADAARFSLDASTGALHFIAAPDAESPLDANGDNVYDVIVRVSDGSFSDTQSLAVSVTPANDNAPMITSVATASVAENTTAVMTVTATDADLPSQTLTYSITGGADAARFAIDATTGALRFVTAPDADVPGDVDGDNVYDVIVQASDGTLADTQAIAVAVTPLNDNAPVFVSAATANVAENTTAVMVVTATDADQPAQTLTYAIVGGADAAQFVLDANTGALSFVGPPDAELPLDANADNVYNVIVQATDGTLASAQAIAVTVTPTNDNAPVITCAATANVAENTTTVMTVTATDADLPSQTLTYSITGGADAARFAIDANTGALRFVTAPDADAPGDANGDNVYDVVVQASDGTLADAQAIVVTVTPSNDNAPVFTSAATANVAENTTAVMTVTATDADQPTQTLTYAIVGGADAAHFVLDAATGALSFVGAPDAELALDANGDNVYEVIVRASDGTLTTAQAMAVTVTPVNDNAPVITSAATASVVENTSAAMTVTAADADHPSQTLTYTITGGADAARFAIDASTGALRFVTAPDADLPGDANGDNVYDVIVQASDGTLTTAQSIAVTVTPTNDNAPVITSAATATIPENSSAVLTVTTTDVDQPTQTLAYAIVGGADAACFVLDATSGALRFVTAPDADAPGDANGDNVYDLIVGVTDGQLATSQAISITVTPLDDNAPVITSDGGGAQAHIAIVLSNPSDVVTQVSASDADLPLGRLTYAIVGGADASRFVIDASSGRLSFASPPGDTMAPSDAGDLRYVVIVAVTDGTYRTTQQLVVQVGNGSSSTPPSPSHKPEITLPANDSTPPADTATPARPTTPPTSPAAGSPAKATPTAPPTGTPAGRAAIGEVVNSAVLGTSRPTPSISVTLSAWRVAPITLSLRAIGERRTDAGVDALLLAAPPMQGNVAVGRTGGGDSAYTSAPIAEPSDAPGMFTDAKVSTVMSVGIVLSLGIVSWAARGVALVTSVLVSSPAWRSIDLLPVLRRRDEDDDWGDDDSADDPDTLLDHPDDRAHTARRNAHAGRRDHETLELE